MKAKKLKKQKVISIIILMVASISLLLGVFFRFKELKKYEGTAVGYFQEASIYSKDDTTTYSLKYSYYVGGTRYEYQTNYGVSVIPKENSTRKIKYNLEQPEVAYLEGLTLAELTIFISLITLFMVATYFISQEYIRAFFIGISFGLLSVVILAFTTGKKNPLFIFEAFKEYGSLMIPSFFFLLMGVMIFVSPFLPKTFSFEGKEKALSLITSDKVQNFFWNTVRTGNIVYALAQASALLFSVVLLGFAFGQFIKNMPIVSAFLGIFILYLFFAFLDTIYKLWKMVINKEDSEELIDKEKKIYKYVGNFLAIVFMIGWFSFLILYDFIAIKQGEIGLFLFSLLFWLVGYLLARKTIKNYCNKKSKKN